MLLVLLAAGAAQTLDPQMVRTPVEPARCNPELARTAVYAPAELRRLGRLPPAFPILAVDKRVAGCSVTVLPQRDEHGNHLMMRGSAPRLAPAHEGHSGGQRRSQRHR